MSKPKSIFDGHPLYRQATRQEHIANVEAIFDGPIVKGPFTPFGAPEVDLDRDPVTGKIVAKKGDRS